ncbi:MAG: hypothetical protein KDC66_01790 [Phaeodactylibacter sp.]|nr:hypothetical protein [Phaeodactylibacter sp.]MCB9275665.1 hypothetical protein [Lewinellaceae bacterium]
MHYKMASAWIFAILVFLVLLMFLHPSTFVIWLGFIGLPVLLVIQALIILRAKDDSKHSFEDEKWYEDRP